MNAPLPRMRRIGMLREVEHQAAARAAAAAETARADLGELTRRTLALTRDYVPPGGDSDGAALGECLRFANALRAILECTLADLARADGLADERLAGLAAAGRRRDAVRARIEADTRRSHSDEEAARLTALVAEAAPKRRDGPR